MKTKNLLYFDRYFKNEVGADKNRSRYLYQVLGEEVSVTCCIIDQDDASKNVDRCLFIKEAHFKNPLKPFAILKFSKNDNDRIYNYIIENNIDTLFFRTIAFSELAKEIERRLPNIKIYIDVDLLFSRLMKQAWLRNPSVKSRFYLFQWLLLGFYESALFKKDYVFLLTNKIEVDELVKKYPNNNIDYLQNTTDLIPIEPGVGKTRQVVFFGAMNSSANVDGYKYIHDTLYPLVTEHLEKYDYKIIIAGKGCDKLPLSKHSRLEVVGKVDSIEELLTQCRFVLLPIFIASGTNTRVIETAMVGRAVLTTPLAMEGLVDVESQDYIVTSPFEMAELFKKMIDNDELVKSIAIQLQEEVMERFSFDKFKYKIKILLSNMSD